MKRVQQSSFNRRKRKWLTREGGVSADIAAGNNSLPSNELAGGLSTHRNSECVNRNEFTTVGISDTTNYTDLNGNAVVVGYNVEARLQVGIILNLGRVDHDLLAFTVVTVLSSLEPLSVLMHVKAVRKDCYGVNLCVDRRSRRVWGRDKGCGFR